jgi:hypothetical protein
MRREGEERRRENRWFNQLVGIESKYWNSENNLRIFGVFRYRERAREICGLLSVDFSNLARVW